jgi:hypothetical protein
MNLCSKIIHINVSKLIKAAGFSLAAILFMTFTFRSSHISAAKYPEYQIKAAFLHSFAHFIKWEKSDSTPTLRYCVLRQGPVEKSLQALINSKEASGFGRQYLFLKDLSNFNTCNILFLSTEADLDRLSKNVLDEQLLTISDVSGFLEKGGMIELRREKSKIHVHINLELVRSHKIKISSKLLNLANIYKAKRSVQ